MSGREGTVWVRLNEIGVDLWGLPVRDVTWLSGQSVHLAKWMHALEQVIDWHLVKWPHQLTT